MPATKLNLVIEQGATFTLRTQWFTNKAKRLPKDLTGYRARMQIRPSSDSAEVLYDSQGYDSRIVAWHQMNIGGSPSTAGVQSIIFPRVQNWLKWGWVDSSSGETRWSMDRLLDLKITKHMMGWIWGMVDGGYTIGPFDPTYPWGGPPPATTGCEPITEEQHRVMVGSSYINQIRAELALGTPRRTRITELSFYHGCAPFTAPVSPFSPDPYMVSAIACGAGMMFDAEAPILASGTPNHMALRARMRQLNVRAGCEAIPAHNASATTFMVGEQDIVYVWGFGLNAFNTASKYWLPWELRAAGKRNMPLLTSITGIDAPERNLNQIAVAKQVMADGDTALIPFGYGGETMTAEQVQQLVAFDQQVSANGDITIGASDGTVNVKIPPATTAAIKARGQAAYDILLISPSGEITRYLEGSVDIRAQVTVDSDSIVVGIGGPI